MSMAESNVNVKLTAAGSTLKYWNIANTVEQEIFTTGKFREIGAQAIRVHEISASFWLAEVLSFKMTPCLLNSDNY